jgi:hypothetical protein
LLKNNFFKKINFEKINSKKVNYFLMFGSIIKNNFLKITFQKKKKPTDPSMEKLNFSTQKLMEKTKKREKQFYTKYSESAYDRGKDKNAR